MGRNPLPLAANFADVTASTALLVIGALCLAVGLGLTALSSRPRRRTRPRRH